MSDEELGRRLLARIADEVAFLDRALTVVDWHSEQRSVLEARREALRDVAGWIGER